MNYWLAVVSKEHVLSGVEGGFAQVCHGKKEPLSKMKAGDFLIYYSPKVEITSFMPCKCFTAIGKVKKKAPYQVKMTEEFHPYRLDIEYLPCHEAPILHLMDQLDLTKGTHWGLNLRKGILALSESDFHIIAAAMGVKL